MSSGIGKTIRELRRSKNWTLEQLSSRIGIQKGPLGRIERGLNLPSAKVLQNLSDTLCVPIDTFFPTKPKFVFTHCSKESKDLDIEPTKKLIEQVLQIKKAFHALEDICSVQKFASIPLTVPSEPTKDGMEKLAKKVLTYFGVLDVVIYEYFELFENCGLRIVVFPFPKNDFGISSISIYEPENQNVFFFLDSTKNVEKQLFSLVSDLGKILIQNQINIQHQPLFPKAGRKEKRPINFSRAAGWFAGTFLMPQASVRKSVKQIGVAPNKWSYELLLRLKHRFGVSAESFLYRLDDLELITKELKEEFKIKIDRHYEKTNFGEPDASKRKMTPNGRFFDLLAAAKNLCPEQAELHEIEQLAKDLKIIRE